MSLNTHQACKILDVKSDAPPGEIKAAYRRLALKLHPDRKKSDGSGKRFQEINEAYNTLRNKKSESPDITKKAQYSQKNGSQKSRYAQSGRRWGPPPGQEKPPEQDWSKYTQEFEDENPDFWREYERKFWEDYNKTINADGKNGEYEKAKEPKAQPNLFVAVDPSLCIACQSCETIAPNVFHIDTESNMNPKSKVVNMRGAGFNRIMNAAETCPTKAIIVDNKDTKERLFPI